MGPAASGIASALVHLFLPALHHGWAQPHPRACAVGVRPARFRIHGGYATAGVGSVDGPHVLHDCLDREAGTEQVT